MLINNGKLQMKTGEIEKNGIYTWNQVTIWLRKQIHPMHHGVVPADHKKTSRIEILKYIIRNCEKVLWGVKDY